MHKVSFNSITSVRYIGSNTTYFGTLSPDTDDDDDQCSVQVRYMRPGEIVLSRAQTCGFSHQKIVKILTKYRNIISKKNKLSNPW